jgi:hypothetical protein
VKLLGTRKRKVGAVLAIGLVAGMAGIASAYWTQGGSGTGTASTGTTANVVVNQTSTVSGLFPGSAAQPLSGDFSNPNSGSVKVGTVTAVVDPAFSVPGDTTKPPCTAADFTISGSAVVNAEIPAGTHVGSWGAGGTLTIAMNDLTTNQDNCKSLADITIDYTVSAAS